MNMTIIREVALGLIWAWAYLMSMPEAYHMKYDNEVAHLKKQIFFTNMMISALVCIAFNIMFNYPLEEVPHNQIFEYHVVVEEALEEEEMVEAIEEEQILTGVILTENTITEHTFTEHTFTEHIITENIITENTIVENTLIENAITENIN